MTNNLVSAVILCDSPLQPRHRLYERYPRLPCCTSFFLFFISSSITSSSSISTSCLPSLPSPVCEPRLPPPVPLIPRHLAQLSACYKTRPRPSFALLIHLSFSLSPGTATLTDRTDLEPSLLVASYNLRTVVRWSCFESPLRLVSPSPSGWRSWSRIPLIHLLRAR